VRRKRGNRVLECSGCRRKVCEIYDCRERAVRDLPWGKFQTTVYIEVCRVRCPDGGVKREKVSQLPSKAPLSKRFEEAVGRACESAPARQVGRQFGLAASTVRAIDWRYLERWDAARRRPALRQMGVDEIHLGKKAKFLTVVCHLETAEPLWFGRERKKRDAGRVLSDPVAGYAAAEDRGGLRGHVAAVPAEHRAVGVELPHHL